MSLSECLTVLADGTVKQRNPLTGTRVWTVAGRGNRPLQVPIVEKRLLNPADFGRHCAFCEQRLLETTPEKSRLVAGQQGRHLATVGADELFDTTAEFRRFGNLFEILTWEYWRDNTGAQVSAEAIAHYKKYTDSTLGRDHVIELVRTKLRASGWLDTDIDALSQDELLERSMAFFASGHDVIVARRHFVDGAENTTQQASSGTLDSSEHARYILFTLDAIADLYATHPQARYVAAFQNWLKPAGASFDHLHKQVVAIDEWGEVNEKTLIQLKENPTIFADIIALVEQENLIIARNDHAIAYAGIGHRYPTIEILSLSEASAPWEADIDEIIAMSDLLHAIHSALGSAVPCNEEWHYRPPDCEVFLPWRINVTLRTSTLAGFEGGTNIYLNTVSPASLKERLLVPLQELLDAGQLGDIRSLGC